MLGGHLPELMIVLVGALLIFGPKRLPEIGSSLGQGIRDFKRSVSDNKDPVLAPQTSSVVVEQPETEHVSS